MSSPPSSASPAATPSLIPTLPKNCGVIICGHGSRAAIAQHEFARLTKALRARLPAVPIEYGFLEYAVPNIHMALARLVEQGVQEIYALPGMLFRATHAKNDIPAVLCSFMQQHPQVTIHYGTELGLHPAMITAFETRILAALSYSRPPPAGTLYDTMLVVVGRGTSVAEANAEVAKLARIVTENIGFGWCETIYSGVTFPSVGRGLEMAVKLGFDNIVVAPYFLFSGRLIGRIRAYVDKVAAENPTVRFLCADYLRDQAHVLDAFLARLGQLCPLSTARDSSVNLLQDFQTRLAAGEITLHHHHAEFHEHTHEHVQKHAHTHTPYRHIAHPHGPRSMIDEHVCCCFMSQFPAEVIAQVRAQRGQQQELPTTPDHPQCQRD